MIRLDKGEKVVGVDRIDGLGDEEDIDLDDTETDTEIDVDNADVGGEEE